MGACTTCRKAKRKCQYEEGEIICKRCQRLSLFYGWVIECIPHVSGQGVRKCGVKGECNAVDDEEGPGSGFLSLEDSGSPDNDSDVKPSFAEASEDNPPGYRTGVDDDDDDIVPELMITRSKAKKLCKYEEGELVDDKKVTLSCQDAHGLFRGINLANEQASISYDFAANNPSTRLDTYTKGGRFFFTVGSDCNLVPTKAVRRLKLPMEGRCTFLESTCMVNLRESCTGVVAVIKANPSSPWKLVVISALHDMMVNGEDILEFYQWNGSTSSSGCPECFSYSNWDQMSAHFSKQELDVSQIHVAYFVNQVRGMVPMHGDIRPDTRNSVDGGVQCSTYGPDKWNIPKPRFSLPSQSISLKDCKIEEGDADHSNLLVLNPTLTKAKKRRKVLNIIPAEESSDIHNFYRPPQKN